MKSLNQFKAVQMQNPDFAQAYQKIKPDIDAIRASIDSKSVQTISPDANTSQGKM